jgi:transposase InsO family protein
VWTAEGWLYVAAVIDLFSRRVVGWSMRAAMTAQSVMTKLENNRCANCGGKFGLVSHHHWGLRFCHKACKDNYLAKTAKDYACLRRWFGFLPRGAA